MHPTPMTPDQGELLYTGPSERGWHRIESMLRCPRLYALRHIEGLEFQTSRPLVSGTLIHLALAHHYKRLQCRQQGTDPDVWKHPEHAVVALAEKNAAQTKLWGEVFPNIAAAYYQYRQNWSAEKWKVLEVEEEMRARLGPEKFLYTQRPDLVVEDEHERVWIVDHKSTYRIGSKTLRQHILDGQFLGYQMFGRAKYGERFAGVIVNRIKLTSPYDFDRRALEPAPAALKNFTETVINAERLIQKYGKDNKISDFPMALNNQTCFGKYGQCSAFEQCQFGLR